MFKVAVTKYQQEFKTSVAGVTHYNTDGTDRQLLLRKCRPGEAVELRREPNNPYDRFAIAVISARSEILGYIPAGDRRLAEHMDRGGETRASIVAITGGRNVFQRLFGLPGKCYGCVLRIIKRDFDWEAVQPWMEADTEIKRLVKLARQLEKDSPDKAIAQYRYAIEKIVVLDSKGIQASAWRTVTYPIDRLSLVLDRHGETGEALAAIACWRAYADPVGISDSERESITKREARLASVTSA